MRRLPFQSRYIHQVHAHMHYHLYLLSFPLCGQSCSRTRAPGSPVPRGDPVSLIPSRSFCTCLANLHYLWRLCTPTQIRRPLWIPHNPSPVSRYTFFSINFLLVKVSSCLFHGFIIWFIIKLSPMVYWIPFFLDYVMNCMRRGEEKIVRKRNFRVKIELK